MTLDKAKQIILEIAAARRKWGKQANPPYKLDVIMDALVAISPELSKSCPEQLISAEELTKLRRQYAACQNREKARNGNGAGSMGDQ
jgi:hypothetical protein